MSWRGCVTRFDGSTHSGSVRGVRVDEARRVLGLDPDAPIDAKVLRKSFRRLVRVAHPDVNAGADAAERTTRLTLAYRVLSEAALRGESTTSVGARASKDRPAPGGSGGSTPERGPAPSGDAASARRGDVPGPGREVPRIGVRLVGNDSISVSAPAEETLMLLVDAAHDLGEISYLDRTAGLLEVIVEFVEAPTSSVLFSLQGRADGTTEVFCTVEALSGGDSPPAEAVTRLVLRTLRDTQA